MGEQATPRYAIYFVSAKYEWRKIDGEWQRDATHWMDWMYRDAATPEMIADRLASAWTANCEKRGYDEVRRLQFTIIRKPDEEWCSGWFSHWTFDDGRTDVEFRESFASFVFRVQRLNEEAYDQWNGVGYFSEPYCLMGAEDRWRWCSRPEGNFHDRERRSVRAGAVPMRRLQGEWGSAD